MNIKLLLPLFLFTNFCLAQTNITDDIISCALVWLRCSIEYKVWYILRTTSYEGFRVPFSILAIIDWDIPTRWAKSTCVRPIIFLIRRSSIRSGKIGLFIVIKAIYQKNNVCYWYSTQEYFFQKYMNSSNQTVAMTYIGAI